MKHKTVLSTKARRGRSAAVVCVSATLALAACGSSSTRSGSAASGSGGGGGSIPVGAETSLTGSIATFGAQALQGVRAGAYAVNTGGGVLSGRKLTLIAADDASDPVDAVPPAHKLVDVNHIAFQVGEAGGDAEAINPIFTRAQIPFMMPGGDVFFNKNPNPYIWRLSPSDSQLGVAMALWAHQKGYKRAAVLFRTGDVAQSIVPVVSGAFKRMGGIITSSQIVQPDLSSYSSEVSKAVAGKPQVIFSETDPPTEAVIFKDLASAGVTNLPTIGTDDMVGDAMLKGIGIPTSIKLMTNVEAGTFNSPAVPIFNNAVQASTHQAPQAGAQNTYDGVIITALAMDLAKTTSGPAVNAAISKVTASGGTVVYSYAAGKKALQEGKRITYVGASGPFNFDQYHNVYGPFVAVVATPGGTVQDNLHDESWDSEVGQRDLSPPSPVLVQ